MQGQHKVTAQTIHLKGMALEPELLRCPPKTTIIVRVTNNHSCSFESTDRKFIFLIEETDEESPPLTSGQQYHFTLPLQSGTYNLQCINYTKIRCTIEVQGHQQEQEPHLEQTRQAMRAPSPLCDLSEVKEEKDQQLKEGNGGEEQEKNTNSKSQFADYERMLSDQHMHYDYMPNKYLKYFKEQFKLWRDFFETPLETPLKQSSAKKQPVKEATSSASLSLSERQSQKQGSVISHLRSQQQMSQMQEQQLNRNKIMKKTNSEYRLNVQKQGDKNNPSDSKRKQINTNTSSPNPRTEQSEVDSFVDWAWGWADQHKLGEVNMSSFGDGHLVRQWFVYLQNKFKISQLMYL